MLIDNTRIRIGYCAPDVLHTGETIIYIYIYFYYQMKSALVKSVPKLSHGSLDIITKI